MNYLTWMMRAKRWVARPPSEGRVKFILGIIAACAALYIVELTIGWPEFLTPDRVGRGGPR